jgi:hypothetical protein
MSRKAHHGGVARVWRSLYIHRMTYRPYLESEIRERRERLAKLNEQRVAIQAEIHAFEQMLHHLVAESEDAPGSGESEHATVGDAGLATESPVATGFTMSDHWKATLKRLDDTGKSFSARDILNTAKAVGYRTSIRNVRSQMAHYNKRQYIRRVSTGRYVVAEKGRNAIRTAEGSDASTSEPSSRSVGVAGLPDRDPHQVPPVGSIPTTSTSLSPSNGYGPFDRALIT